MFKHLHVHPFFSTLSRTWARSMVICSGLFGHLTCNTVCQEVGIQSTETVNLRFCCKSLGVTFLRSFHFIQFLNTLLINVLLSILHLIWVLPCIFPLKFSNSRSRLEKTNKTLKRSICITKQWSIFFEILHVAVIFSKNFTKGRQNNMFFKQDVWIIKKNWMSNSMRFACFVCSFTWVVSQFFRKIGPWVIPIGWRLYFANFVSVMSLFELWTN